MSETLLTFKEIYETYPNSYVIAEVALRNAKFRKALAFKVYETCDSSVNISEIVEKYKDRGIVDAVVISTFDDEDDEERLPPAIVAKFFRQYYGLK